MKIISWNVNGIRACAKKGLLDFIQVQRPDILCLQETKAHLEQVEEPLRQLGFRRSLWSSATRKGYSGVATFFNDEVQTYRLGNGQSEYDSEGRFVITEHGAFSLYNIYFPNGGSGDVRHQFKQQFLRDFQQHCQLELQRGRRLVVLGDYNIAHREVDVHDPVRLSKESGFLPEERQWMSEFLDGGFTDTFRWFHPQEKERYSWWSYRELARVNNRGWRIDYICVSNNLQSALRSADILQDVEGSDHCPLVVELDL